MHQLSDLQIELFKESVNILSIAATIFVFLFLAIRILHLISYLKNIKKSKTSKLKYLLEYKEPLYKYLSRLRKHILVIVTLIFSILLITLYFTYTLLPRDILSVRAVPENMIGIWDCWHPSCRFWKPSELKMDYIVSTLFLLYSCHYLFIASIRKNRILSPYSIMFVIFISYAIFHLNVRPYDITGAILDNMPSSENHLPKHKGF